MRRTSLYQRLALGFILLALASSVAVAAETRFYDVELVVFVRADAALGEDEAWLELDEPPVFDELPPPGSEGSNTTRVPASARRLGPVAYSLDRRGTRTLYHTAWRQAATSRNRAPKLRIQALPRLDGSVRLSVSRYLHLDADLVYRPADANPAAAIRFVAGRKMRSEEVHYLDHPILGIVVRVDPVVTSDSGDSPSAAPAAEQSSDKGTQAGN